MPYAPTEQHGPSERLVKDGTLCPSPRPVFSGSRLPRWIYASERRDPSSVQLLPALAGAVPETRIGSLGGGELPPTPLASGSELPRRGSHPLVKELFPVLTFKRLLARL